MSDKAKDTTPKNLNRCQEMLEQEKQNAFAHGAVWVTYWLLLLDGNEYTIPKWQVLPLVETLRNGTLSV